MEQSGFLFKEHLEDSLEMANKGGKTRKSTPMLIDNEMSLGEEPNII